MATDHADGRLQLAGNDATQRFVSDSNDQGEDAMSWASQRAFRPLVSRSDLRDGADDTQFVLGFFLPLFWIIGALMPPRSIDLS